jgi:hypothetical protein
LNWAERDQEPHASVYCLYQTLLRFRRTEPALIASEPSSFEVTAINESAILLVRHAAAGPSLIVIVQLRGAGMVDLSGIRGQGSGVRNQGSRVGSQGSEGRRWQTVLTTEDPEFCHDPNAPEIDLSLPAARFRRPGAVILRGW